MATTLTIDFHGDPLLVIRDEDRGDLVPLRPLVTGMGLDWGSQLQRVKRDPILGPVVVMTTTTASPAGDKEGVCLPLDFVPGFLFRIDANRVAERVRPKVLDYQRGCYRTLSAAVFGRPGPAGEAASPKLTMEQALSLVREGRQTFDRFAARALWFKSGLPVVAEMHTEAMSPDLFTYTAERAGGQP